MDRLFLAAMIPKGTDLYFLKNPSTGKHGAGYF
jgi:hypothetical protein